MRLVYEHARGSQTYVAILQSSALQQGRAITVARIERVGVGGSGSNTRATRVTWAITWEHRALQHAGVCSYADTLAEARALVEHALFDYLER